MALWARRERVVRRPAPPFTAVAPFYDQLMRCIPYDEWVEYVLQVLARENFRPARVLDLACGTARVALEFVVRGFSVVGADKSEAMLGVAQEAIRGQHLPTSLACCDARSLPFRSAFDLVVCFYDSFNYILSPEGLAECFRGCALALRSPGYLLFDLNTIRALEGNLFTQDNSHTRDPLQYRWRSRYNRASRLCTIEMEFCYAADGQRRRFSERHVQRGYELGEVEEYLAVAGFEVRQIYDGFSFRPPGPRSDRVVFVARKG